MHTEEFDYVIVGGGSAGCVLAARLSEEADARVLLLEAGPSDWHPLIRIPLGVGQLRQSRMYDWGIRTEPQQHLEGRRIEMFGGQVLGGSSSVNFMAHNRGNRSDYDRWSRMGLSEWTYDELLPYFKRVESWREKPSPQRGSDGPISVNYTCRSDPLAWAVLDAARSAGLPIFDDLNGGEPEGFGLAQSAISKGRRASASRAYLHPVQGRPNLVVRTAAHATRIVMERNVAVAVQYLHHGALAEVRASREVIVSSGAMNSPRLLMLSGIGNANDLRAVGISPTHHLPGVGANLQDHLAVALTHRRTGEESSLHRMLRLDRLALALLNAYFFGKGPATELPAGVNGIIRSRPGLDAPDMQLIFGAGALEGRPWVPGIGNWKDAFYLRPTVAHPESRGSIRLASADPTQQVRVDPAYLSNVDDLRTLRAGLRIVRNIVRQPSLDGFRGEELAPGADCTSDADVDAYIRKAATTMQHPSCTCKMGVDDMAVVDSQLQVRGLQRLRVVDASVLPEIVSCNINALVLAIAERASDLVRGRVVASSQRREHAESAEAALASA